MDGLLLDQKVLGPNFFMTKTTITITTTTTLMGFDTIEINLVLYFLMFLDSPQKKEKKSKLEGTKSYPKPLYEKSGVWEWGSRHGYGAK